MFLISVELIAQGVAALALRGGQALEPGQIDRMIAAPLVRNSAAESGDPSWRKRPTTSISTAIRRISSR